MLSIRAEWREWVEAYRNLAGEWFAAVFHVRQNPLVRQHLTAARRRRASPVAIVGVLLLVMVFAVITSQEAVQWFEYLFLGKKLSSMPIVSFGPPEPILHGPGLKLFRIGLVASYLLWLFYALCRALVDSLGVLSAGGTVIRTVRFPDETRMSAMSDADFVVAAQRLIWPKLAFCSIGGAVVFLLVLWSFGAEYPGHYGLSTKANWPDILVAASMFAVTGLLGATIVILTFITLGRGNQSGLFQLAIGALIPALQLAWLWVLFSDLSASWLRGRWWIRWQETAISDYLQAVLLFAAGTAMSYCLLFRWAAVNSVVRRVLAFAVVGLGVFSYWAAASLGNAVTFYCGTWLSDWDYVLDDCRDWVAAPFAVLNTTDAYHNIRWESYVADFWFHGLYNLVASSAPLYLGYTIIQLVIILLLAHFARDAVARWRRGEP